MTELNTSLVSLSVTTQLQPSPELQKKLNNVKQKAAYTNQLLKEYRDDPDKFMETNDEDSIAALTTEINSALAVYKEQQSDRKEIKQFAKQQVDELLRLYDSAFADNNIEELEKAKRDISQIKKELSFRRKDSRWSELQPVFTNTIANYPNIQKYTPELADFAKFRIMHDKLVSGAKVQSPVMNSVKKNVRDLIADMNAGIDLIVANGWGLNPAKQTQLLNVFKNNPTSKIVLEEGPLLKQQQETEIKQELQRQENIKRQQEAAEKARKEAERKQKELQEQQRLAKIKQDALAQEALKRQQERLQKEQEEAKRRAQELEAQLQSYKNDFIAPNISDKYPEYVKDLFMRTQGQTLHGNERAKANELYYFMTSMSNTQSIPYQATQGDPGRTIELVRFIIDL